MRLVFMVMVIAILAILYTIRTIRYSTTRSVLKKSIATGGSGDLVVASSPNSTSRGRICNFLPQKKDNNYNESKWNMYRISDGIRWYYDRPDRVASGCDRFPGTLTCRYQEITSGTKEKTTDPVKIATVVKLLETEFKTPYHSNVTMHLRLGDGLCSRGENDRASCQNVTKTGEPDCWNTPADCSLRYTYPAASYKAAAQKLQASVPNGTQVLIFANPKHYTARKDPRKGVYTQDNVYCNHVANFLRESGYVPRVALLGNNPDVDFSVLCSSKVFISGGGGFSELIGQIVAARNGTVIKVS